jgi:hypothetical protein
MLFLSVRGFSDYAGSTGHSRLAQPAMLPSSCCRESRHPVLRVFEAQSPRPLIPLSTLRPAPRDADRKTQGQDGFAFSFLVGLFHPHQHAGLSRRSYPSRLQLIYNAPDEFCQIPDHAEFGFTRSRRIVRMLANWLALRHLSVDDRQILNTSARPP